MIAQVRNIVCAAFKVECYCCGKRFKPEPNGYSCDISGVRFVGYPYSKRTNIKQYHFCSQECFFALMNKGNV